MTATIHPTAIVHKNARLGERVEIGPYCIIGENVNLGNGCKLISHVCIEGFTTIGAANTFYPFCSIGMPPQDLKYNGEATRLTIGNNNTFRESVTVNTGTVQDNGITKIGDSNLFMALAHIAHDCNIGSNCVLANGATLAGHVHVEDSAIIGGLSGVHQFVRIGTNAMIGGHSAVDKDVLPYSAIAGARARLTGLNLIGLRRRDFSRETIRALQDAFAELFDDSEGSSLDSRANQLKTNQSIDEVAHLAEFVNTSERGLIAPAAGCRIGTKKDNNNGK